MNETHSPLRIVSDMAKALTPGVSRPTSSWPGADMESRLSKMMEIFVRESGAARAVAILLEPDAEVPRLCAAVPDAGTWAPRGEGLREILHPAPPHLLPAPALEAEGGQDGRPAQVFVRPLDGPHGAHRPLAAAPFEVALGDGRMLLGALAVEIDPGSPALAALPGAAALAALAVAWRHGVAALHEAHAAETAMLRGHVSAGFAETFGPGGCPGLAALRAQAEQAARESGPVFLQGEPGTGKARLARLIHDLSPRGRRPFATAPATDMEAVFGRSEAGFFRPGAVEDAAGGTLYLADAADSALDRTGQERLARLIREGEYARCGSQTKRLADVRVILGACCAPGELARSAPGLAGLLGPAGGMRVIRLPALRERPGDVPVLMQRAVELHAGRGGQRPSFTPRAVKALCAYPWPGNDEEVRTLAAEVLLARSGERVDVEDLPPRVFSLAAGAAGGEETAAAAPEAPDAAGDADTLWDMERARVLAALERHGWVRTRAARELGLTPRQIGWRMKRHGLTRGG
jgi:DNA-binding NtrC family response regulator